MGSSGPKLCSQNRALLDEQNCTVQGFLSALSKRCLHTKISSSEPGLQLHQHPHRPLADKQLWIPVPKWSQTLNAMKRLCPWTVAISYRVVTNSILPTKMRICTWQRHHAAALTALPGHSALLTSPAPTPWDFWYLQELLWSTAAAGSRTALNVNHCLTSQCSPCNRHVSGCREDRAAHKMSFDRMKLLGELLLIFCKLTPGNRYKLSLDI